METERTVSTAEGQALASKFGMSFVECSAKSNLFVHDSFLDLVRNINKWRQKHAKSANGANSGGSGSAGAAVRQHAIAKRKQLKSNTVRHRSSCVLL